MKLLNISDITGDIADLFCPKRIDQKEREKAEKEKQEWLKNKEKEINWRILYSGRVFPCYGLEDSLKDRLDEQEKEILEYEIIRDVLNKGDIEQHTDKEIYAYYENKTFVFEVLNSMILPKKRIFYDPKKAMLGKEVTENEEPIVAVKENHYKNLTLKYKGYLDFSHENKNKIRNPDNFSVISLNNSNVELMHNIFKYLRENKKQSKNLLSSDLFDDTMNIVKYNPESTRNYRF